MKPLADVWVSVWTAFNLGQRDGGVGSTGTYPSGEGRSYAALTDRGCAVILPRKSGRGQAAIRSMSAGERYPIAECRRREL